MNKLTIIGNVTRDPESKTVGTNTVCNFTVAVNRRKSVEGQPDSDFFRVAAWGKLGENCSRYIHKGMKVAVEGSVSCRAYISNDGTAKASLEVMANDVEFLSKATVTMEGEEVNANIAEQIAPAVTAAVNEALPF